IDALNFGRDHGAARRCRNEPVVDPFADQRPPDRPPAAHGLRQRCGTNRTKIGRDLVGRHFFQPQTEEVRRIPTVGTRGHVSTRSAGTARPAVAARAAVAQPGADRENVIDVARAVAGNRPLSLKPRELPLEQLSAAPDTTERIALDDEQRATLAADAVSSPISDFLLQRLVYAFLRRVGCEVLVDELGEW